ncbi:MAG: DUF58 domain-containing protein [Campylobacterota bacterium]|nr:DUF58 domain-containing protein [Campylobacterota bacterium]
MQSLKTLLSIHKNVKVRATKYFILLVLAIVSLFIQAYMHNYNIVYIMMFFLTAVAGTSTIFGMLNLSPLELKLLSNTRVFATKTSPLTFLANNSANYAIYDLDFSYENKSTYLSNLVANNSKVISLDFSFSKRGEEKLGSIHVESFFPLIHERKFRDFLLEEKILVYPNPKGISLEQKMSQAKHSSGDLDDFKGLTRFEQGENFSAIHWASLAKNERLMAKRFEYSQAQEKLFFSFNELSGDTEDRLSQLTLWVLEAEKYGYAFKLELGSTIFDSKKVGIDAILDALAQY